MRLRSGWLAGLAAIVWSSIAAAQEPVLCKLDSRQPPKAVIAACTADIADWPTSDTKFHAYALTARGAAFTDLDDTEAARRDLDQAVTLDPGLASARVARGQLRYRLGDFDGAKADLPGSLFGRGIAKLRKGDRAGGEADLAAARRVDADVDKDFAGYRLVP